MTAKELIAKLKKVDPDSEVWVLDVINENEETEYDGTNDPPQKSVYIVKLDDGFIVRVERNIPDSKQKSMSVVEVL